MSGVAFEVSTEEIRKHADSIITLIKELQSDFKSMEYMVIHSERFWMGEASKTHQEIFLPIQEEMQVSLKNMESKAYDLFEMAGIYEENELEAQSQVADLSKTVLRIR